jgi:hypothetical protein
MHLASAGKGRTGTTRTAAQPCSPPSHNRAATARGDAARSKDQLLGVVMTLLRDCSQPRVTAPDRVPSRPVGTWTVDPSRSNVSFAWRRLRPWTLMGRLPCFGVIHLDELPPVGVRQFEQPSGLPVLTIALDPAGVETQAADDVLRHRWWTLRSESLEILPTGAWRVMATLTADGSSGLLELRVEVDPAASSPDWLVLRGRGLLDRRAFGIASPGSTYSPKIRLDLVLRARRVGGPLPHVGEKGGHARPGRPTEQATADAERRKASLAHAARPSA